MPDTNMEPYLVADIGGTNARFALAHAGAVSWPTLISYPTTAFPSLQAAASHYLAAQHRAVDTACIAMAGPLRDGTIALTNGTWRTERAALQAALGWRQLTVLNDFAAQALALPQLRGEQLAQIGAGSPTAGVRVAMGPGTGFGVAALLPTPGGALALPSEAGHASLGAGDEAEIELFGWLLRELGVERGAVYRELLLSGSGLELLQRAWSALRGWTPAARSAPEIVAAAQAGETAASAALDSFCALLGSAARDLALSFGAHGGVYIAGGIVRHFVPWLRRSRFRQRFESSAKLRDYLTPIPTYVVIEAGTGLIGAALAHLARGEAAAALIPAPMRAPD